MKILIKNISRIVQTEEQPRLLVCGADMAVIGSVENGWLAIKDGIIDDFGNMRSMPEVAGYEIIDATGRLVFPSFCDSHTHLVYAGSREKEFVDKIRGLSYEEIAARGGGILNSAKRLHETSEEELFRQIAAAYPLPLKILSDKTYDGVSASDFALVCSGTATLETALLATPMAILYKVNLATWAFIRMMIRIPYIGLVNVVAGKKIAEEFIQFDCCPQKVADYAICVLQDKDRLNRLKLELLPVRQSLGEAGASLRAAKIVCKELEGHPRT